jgi:adenylate kinase family enzyme
MTKNKYDIILFWGRPGSGKSEVIDFLVKVPLEERLQKYNIGEFTTIDDYEFLWEKGEEDDILEELGQKRLYTIKDPTGYAIDNDILYKILIKKINNKFSKFMKTNPKFFDEKTLFIEFSRGGKTAYSDALNLLDDNILKRSVVLYVAVSFEESLRKNRDRYDENAKESILHHSLPDFVMNKYKYDDWYDLISKDKNYINVKGFNLKHITFNNEPKITDDAVKMEKHLLEIL